MPWNPQTGQFETLDFSGGPAQALLSRPAQPINEGPGPSMANAPAPALPSQAVALDVTQGRQVAPGATAPPRNPYRDSLSPELQGIYDKANEMGKRYRAAVDQRRKDRKAVSEYQKEQHAYDMQDQALSIYNSMLKQGAGLYYDVYDKDDPSKNVPNEHGMRLHEAIVKAATKRAVIDTKRQKMLEQLKARGVDPHGNFDEADKAHDNEARDYTIEGLLYEP